jgi:cell division protein FtsB
MEVVGITFGIAVAIMAIGITLSAMFKDWLKHRERQLELQAEATAEKAAQYAAHTERLEQRVRVLERIVTDKGIAVADEIEKLSGEPLN